MRSSDFPSTVSPLMRAKGGQVKLPAKVRRALMTPPVSMGAIGELLLQHLVHRALANPSEIPAIQARLKQLQSGALSGNS